MGMTGTSIALTLSCSARAKASSSTSIPCGLKIRSTMTSSSHAFSSQPSGGGSPRRPAPSGVARAASPSDGLMIRSRALTDPGPPPAGARPAHGEPERAEVFASGGGEPALRVVAVRGNHDGHANRHDEFVAALREGDVEVLEGASWIGDCEGVEVGVAGVKGFVGGFEGSFQPDFGEPSLRALYRETGGEVEALDRALGEIAGCGVRIALMDYSPLADTLHG